MLIQERKLSGTFEITLEPREDPRGYFVRTYDKALFERYGIARDWVEENESFSKDRGTVRGLHFQYPPHAEGKCIRVTSGEAFIVWVDIRKGSPTFGKWDSIVLSPQARNAVFIPRGFANGLCTLVPDCTLLYKMDAAYHPEAEEVIRWDDPDIGIAWPLRDPAVLSPRDHHAKSFSEFAAFCGGLAVS